MMGGGVSLGTAPIFGDWPNGGGGGGGNGGCIGGGPASRYSRGISTEGEDNGGVVAVGSLTESVRTRWSVAMAFRSNPHEIQKFEPGEFSVPQAGHFVIGMLQKK
jgi:hypothetical protein